MDETKGIKNPAEEFQTTSNEHDAQRDKYMTFKSGSEHFGLKIQYVKEIIQFQSITSIPETEDYIKGLINLRGKVIPVIDAQLRFKQKPFEYNDRTCIIVISVKSTMVGVIVEEIAEVVEIKEQNILPPPAIGHGDSASQNKYVYGIGKVGNSVKLLLDPDKLLNEGDLSLEEQEKENKNEEGEV